MSAETSPIGTVCDPGDKSFTGGVPMRVAVLCDFREEQWPSMDLVGDMLCQQLTEKCRERVTVTRVCPPFRRRLSRLPIGGRKLTWNADRLINRFADYRYWL